MGVKAQRTVKKEVNRLEKLIGMAVTARRFIREFEESHAKELAQYKDLQDALTGIHEQLKIEARLSAKTGKTVVLVDNSDIHISVQGKTQRVFDLAKAKETWPSWALKAVTVSEIDGKAVDSLLEAKTLSAELVDEITKFIPLTPAVSIRLP